MKVTNQNALPIPGSLLTTLRDIERRPGDSMEDMRRIAEVQANTLRSALFGPIHQLPDYVSKMFPSITVEHVADVPIAGVSYWSGQRWHIHVRRSDAAKERVFTILHQLKRIIDDPLRRQTKRFTESDWDALADRFARHVLFPNSAEVVS